MYSDAVKTSKIETYDNNAGAVDSPAETVKAANGDVPVYEKWLDWHASEISHHGKLCCEIAREWITATDSSELGGAHVSTGPRWLRQKFKWGASLFPIFWCEAVRKKTLDCGALAALAFETFKTRGVPTYRVQMVQRFSQTATSQWENSWNLNGEPLAWTNEDLIYHEGCAIAVKDNEIKIWDASAGWWLDPGTKDGYGSLLAVRLSLFNLSPDTRFVWGDHRIDAFRWTTVV